MTWLDKPALAAPGKGDGNQPAGVHKPVRGRHARKCSICHHPDREAIEEAFIHWHSPFQIAIDYHLPDRAAVYRHAYATGLFARRRRNLRFVLENLLERVDRVQVTAHAIVRAVRSYTRINDRGEWIDPPTRVLVIPGSAPPDALPVYTASPARTSSSRGKRSRAEAKQIGSGPAQQKLLEGRCSKTRSILIATRTYSREEPTH